MQYPVSVSDNVWLSPVSSTPVSVSQVCLAAPLSLHCHILSLPSLPLPHPQSHISQSHSHQPQGVNSWYQLYHCKQEKHTEASQRHVNLAQLILYKFLAVWNHMATHGNTTDTNLTWYLQNLSSLNPQNDKFLPEFCLQIFKINNYW